MGIVLGGGRLLAGLAVVVAIATCERHQPAVIGFAFGADSPSVLDVVRAGRPASAAGHDLRFVDPSGMPSEPGAPGQVTMASRFVAMPGIVAVVGHSDSRSTLAAAPVYDEAHVPLLVPTSTSRRLRTVSPWVFMLAPDDSAEALFIADFAVRHLGAHSAAVLYDNDDYGVGLRDFLRGAFGARQTRIIAEEPIGAFCDAGRQAEASLLRAIPRDHPPAVVIVAARNALAACVSRRVYERLATTPIIETDGVEPDSAFLAAVGDAARNSYVVAFWHPNAPGAASATFVRTFRAAMGRTPHASQALLFDAVSLIETAVQDVGTKPAAIRRYLTELGTALPPYEGATGAIAFSGASTQRPLYMLRLAPLDAPPVVSP